MRYSIKELISEKLTGEWGSEAVEDEGTKVLRTTNFTNLGVIDYDNIVTRKIDEKKIQKKHLKNGDIIIEKSGGGPKQPVGRVVFFDLNTKEKYLCNNFTTILRPNKVLVDPKYFFYQLYIAYVRGKTLKYQNKTTGIINLQLDKYLNEEIEVPSLSTQVQIVNILDKVETLIEQRKNSIALLDEYLKSTFFKMFGNTREYSKGDVVKTIGDICFYRGGGTPSKANPEYFTGNIPWISPKDMKSLYIKTAQDKITEQAVKESSTTLIPKGAVLMVIRSGILKNKLPLAINKVDVAINQDMKAFSSNEVCSPYLLYFFFFEEKNILKKVKGTTADNLNFEDIKKLKIKIPPVKLQTQFADTVARTEALKEQYENSLRELENLYGSLSQLAFKGELFKESHSAAPVVPFERKVLAGWIIQMLNARQNFGVTMFQKNLHLCEYVAEVDYDTDYSQNRAGPDDRQFMKAFLEEMVEKKWFQREQKFKVIRFVSDENVGKLVKKYGDYFKSKSRKISFVLDLLKDKSLDDTELISTLYAVWNNRIIKKEKIDAELLTNDVLSWSEEKSKYTRAEIKIMYEWMNEKRLVPVGFGKEIVKQ